MSDSNNALPRNNNELTRQIDVNDKLIDAIAKLARHVKLAEVDAFDLSRDDSECTIIDISSSLLLVEVWLMKDMGYEF